MKNTHTHFISKKNQAGRAGFTLIITISMMVLLAMIAIGLLSLSSVTLRASAASSAMREAQNNARMAMIMAVGELQQQMGPDQRVSATANIAGTSLGDQIGAGAVPQNNLSVATQPKGLSAVQNGTRYWTGVFSNRDDPSLIYARTPSPRLNQWLVSGNHTRQSTGPALTPASTLCAVAANGAVADPTSAVVLAGPNTVGLDATRYVAAPLIPINQNSKTVGRYAWWVGDEGSKALMNRRENTIPNSNYASLQPTRRAWETVTAMANYPIPGGKTADLEKMVSSEQLDLALNAPAASHEAFHSATAHSSGVIADTLNGGTRIDLTQIMNGALPSAVPTEFASIANYPVAGGRIVPFIAASTMQAPRWDEMLDFFTRSRAIRNGTIIARGASTWAPRGTLFPSSPQANNRLGYRTGAISPLIVDFRLLFGLRFRVFDPQFQLNPCGKIAVALANPYSMPLRWERDLEFEVIDTTPRSDSGYRPSCLWQHQEASYINRARASVFHNTVFRIPASTLQPGEARAYSLTSSVRRPQGNTDLISATMGPVDFSLGSFQSCVEMDTLARINMPTGTTTLAYDVRESWQTTSATVELRLTGATSGTSGNLLRRIERFELDNGFFSPNTRRFTANEIRSCTGPIPMMYYNYQISQPGGNYATEMPAGNEMGQRGSTLRTFMDFNLQGTEFSKPIACYTPPPYFMNSNNSISALGANSPGGDTGPEFTKNLGRSPLPWGYSLLGPNRSILFTIPQQIVTLAQLQHADLTGDDTGTSIGHQPGYAFGNSYATPFVQRRSVIQQRQDHELTGQGASVTSVNRNYYDISHLLNSALWDSYYLSNLPYGGSGNVENPVMLRRNPQAPLPINPGVAATQMMIQGAFNVNCTDKNAWKAFLGSSRFFRHSADTASNTNVAFPRSLEQRETAVARPTGTAADSYAGYRRITDIELDQLAEEMVRQVRTRGPFLSLSHFVNRSLAEPVRNRAITRSGPLQAALDEGGCNINFTRNRVAFQNLDPVVDLMSVPEKNGAPRADLDGGNTAGQMNHKDWAVTSQDQNYGTVGSIYADREMLSTLKQDQGFRSTGIPGWINQADVLQVIGSSLSARSDTFRIRAYGESTGTNGKARAKAWCEAIVQRLPEYVDPSNAASSRGANLTNLNQNYGRKFNIITFRWLGSNEI